MEKGPVIEFPVPYWIRQKKTFPLTFLRLIPLNISLFQY